MQEYIRHKSKEIHGITLIALVITIIVLLILAGISISMLSGDNSILQQAGKAKEETTIAEDKEMIKLSLMQALSNNLAGNIEKDALISELSKNTTKTFKVYTDDDKFVVSIENNVYSVDLKGNIEKIDKSILKKDSTPGDIKKAENGKILAGTEDEPFIIMSIEDLVYLSQTTNTGDSLKNKYVRLGRNLDFRSELSYCNYETKEYNEYLGVTDDVGLMEALTNEKYNGFAPNKSYHGGTFDGDGKVIKNLYIKKDGDVAFFVSGSSTQIYIKNLELTGNILCNGDKCASFVTEYSGSVVNCISRVNITITGNNAGGIAVKGKCMSCKYYGIIKGNENIGGIVSHYSSTIDCENYGNISGTKIVGGISGLVGNATRCKNYGIITADTYAGGINGWYGVVKECENYGEITALTSDAGGIIAYARNDTTEKCINYGEINSTNVAGGIVRCI